MDVSAFWSPWEVVVDSFEAVEEQVYGVFEKWSKRGSVFAWRGRISASAVPAIRRRLQELFGYEPLTMYPDYPGFADYGTPRLRRTPPA